MFERLGPTFIKLGQILSTRPDFIPPAYCSEFETCLDSASPLPIATVKKAVKRRLGKDVEDVFAEFDVNPLASASLSQVHKAKLKTGEDVVVKVLRPGVRKIIRSDLRLLSFISFVLTTILRQQALNFPGLVRRLKKWLMEETDYRIEIKNIDRMRRTYRDVRDVYFPKVFPKLSSREILVLEYIDGYSMIDLIRLKRKGEIPEIGIPIDKLVVRLPELTIIMGAVKGYFHADLHPANVIIMPNGKICFLDMGLIDYFDERRRRHVLSFFMGMTFAEPELVYRTSMELADKKTKHFDAKQMFKELSRLCDEFRGASLSEMSHSDFMVQAVNAAMKAGLILPWSLTLYARTCASMDGAILQLRPDIILSKEMKEFFIRTYAESVARDVASVPKLINVFDTLWDVVRKSPDVANDAVQALGEILKKTKQQKNAK